MGTVIRALVFVPIALAWLNVVLASVPGVSNELR
jgi:hypothetical protein